METGQILLGFATAAVVFGPYFVGRPRDVWPSVCWREFFRGLTGPMTRRGLIRAMALPVGWMALYYGFVLHVRIHLGRWPEFGEGLHGWLVAGHYEVVRFLLVAQIASLYFLPVVLGACLLRARWRPTSVYVLVYGASVGLAWGALYLAPHAFLNRLFD